METVYVLFICGLLNGHLAPPCDNGTEYVSAAECLHMIAMATSATPPRVYRFADGSMHRLANTQTLVCMEKTTAPGTFPIWRGVQ